MLSFSPIEKPKIDIELYGTDINIAPIDKVHIMDEDSFEHFTLEWLYGCKKDINQELFKISERNQELTAFLSELSTTDINQEIESLMTQVTENEQRISEAIDENKRILQSLHEKNDALSECNVLINRYQELTTQYGADLKRLSFIVDGTANMPQISETQCP